MSSTLQSLLDRFRKNQTDLKLIATIIQQIVNTKHGESSRVIAGKEIGLMLSRMMSKVDQSKQAATFKYLLDSFNNLNEALMLSSFESSQPQEWHSCISQLYNMADSKLQIAKTVMNSIVNNGQIISIKYILNGQLIADILQQVKQQQVRNDYKQLFSILTNIQHFNSLEFSEPDPSIGPHLYKQTFKAKFQQLALHCLHRVDEFQQQQQTAIYNLLGDSFFSKLVSPLVLSEHLLSKLKKDAVSSQLQIQVLSCLFILVGKYELEMQKFYEKLSLMMESNKNLKKSLFRAKNAKRFIKLVEAAMRSSKVPLKNIIELVKLLLSNIMNQKSQLAYWMLSFLVNLVKKHRQLQNNLFQFPQLSAFKYHYSAKIRSLVRELQKNLNKSEYLDIQEFAKVNCVKICNKKFDEIMQKVQINEQKLQFKIPTSFDLL